MRSLILFLVAFFGLWADVPTVLVSVAPHKYFVNAIGGDKVEVIQMVPSSASPHTYEPTPSQILKAGKAQAWFRVGEGFETRALESLQAYNPNFVSIDLRKGLPLIPTPHHTHTGKCCGIEGADLHIWLSLRMAQLQAKKIYEELAKLSPENELYYKKNFNSFIQKLQTLDQKLTRLFEKDKGRVFLVTHPAYAYFCRDYGLEQMSIEYEGKEPTPQAMNRMLETARKLKIHTVFTQAQYGTKGAALIANLLNGNTIELDPYAEDYLKNMETMAQAIKQSFKNGNG
ncbi:MAG: zinc ABC transporter substrate-binding protein [Chlamydiia bacterium]|nr:zinc ABC transporter substrate-binding protein [Chlamydiia bacterium]